MCTYYIQCACSKTEREPGAGTVDVSVLCNSYHECSDTVKKFDWASGNADAVMIMHFMRCSDCSMSD